MNKNTIEYLAYILNQAREEDLPKAIVFLGAGASASSGIPLTHVIVRHIKMMYKKNPIIKEFISKNETDYYTIMGALTADERRDLFYFYVTRPKVKINVTNIYLAQLLKEGYIDFVLTVNFDDLLLRACALYNFLPPVYDISNISVPTTSNFREKSVIYLHGQHFGQWLLNKKEELDKSKNDITNIFNEIKNRRTWIVVGYSGQDEIFDQITSLGSFTKEFYWVNYKDSDPGQKILDFVNDPNKNAHLLKGYDSDSFFLNLHSEISKLDNCSLETPEIFNKPFTFLQSMMENVKDIEKYNIEKEHEETFRTVKERFENSKEMVDQAIAEIENNIENKLEQEIIEAIIKKDFSKAHIFYDTVKNKNLMLKVSNLYNLWGVELIQKAIQNSEEKLYLESFEKFGIAFKLNPKNDKALNNWAGALYNLGKLREDEELFNESFKKSELLTKINPKSDSGFYNWGISLSNLAYKNSDEKLYRESFKKFKKALELNPKKHTAFNSWAVAISDLAKIKMDKKLYLESFEKYKRSIDLNPSGLNQKSNYATSLLEYSHLLDDPTEKRQIILVAKEYCQKIYNLDNEAYNLACCNALLEDKESAFKYLKISLENNEISKDHVMSDNDWKAFLEDSEFLKILSKY